MSNYVSIARRVMREMEQYPATTPENHREVYGVLLPPGVRLVAFDLKPSPLAITTTAIVDDVRAFVCATLRQLVAALTGDTSGTGNWDIRTLRERLEQAGVVVTVEPEKEAHE